MIPIGTTALLLAVCLMGASAVSVEPSSPLLVEYIDEYRVKVNDLKDVINNQFAKITIGPVKTSYATIRGSSFSLRYDDTAQTEYLTPTKVLVTGDSYTINFSFNVTVQHTLKAANYTCDYTTEPIYVNYTKEVDLISGDTMISGFKSSFAQSLFTKEPRCTPLANKTDVGHIKEVISNSGSSSIYVQLNKVLSKMKDRMQENVKTEHLSQIFTDNPYNYDYYNFIIGVNVSTLSTQQYGEKGIINQIVGSTPQATHTASKAPEHQEGYNLFFSKAFVQNILDYTATNYEHWQNIKANRTNMRSRSFRFRLIDFEYIVPTILQKYPDLYLSDTQVHCKPVGYDNMVFNPEEGTITLDMKWSCGVDLAVAAGSTYTFMNFEPTFAYEVKIQASDYLSVYEKPHKLVNLDFNIIDDHNILNPYFVQNTIEELLFEFATWTIGGFFKVKGGSTQVMIVEDGFWVG